MKTFKQFLEDAGPKHASLQELLNGPCRPFLKQSQKNGLLYRGMKSYGTSVGHLTTGDPEFDEMGYSYYKKAVRVDRHPLSTLPKLHTVIDDWFEEETGIRARSQAVFCYGTEGMRNAGSYGSVAVILPIGNFMYTWSPEIHDLYDRLVDKFYQSEGVLKKWYLDKDGNVDPDKVGAEMDEMGYTINKLSEAVKGNSEIMLQCAEYYVIPCDEKTLPYIEKAFKDA